MKTLAQIRTFTARLVGLPLVFLPAVINAADVASPAGSDVERTVAPPAVPDDPGIPVLVAPDDVGEKTMDRLLGKRVTSRAGVELGALKDFALDPKTGQVVSLDLVTAEGSTTTDHARVPGRGARRERDAIVVDEPALSAGAQPDRGLVRATDLRGKVIRSGDHDLGRVEEVVIDLERGVATALVIPSDEFAPEKRMFLVPLPRLSAVSLTTDPIMTTLVRDDFKRAQPAPGAAPAEPLAPTGRVTPGERPRKQTREN